MTVSVRYIVDDVDQTADFYSANLGFEVRAPSPGFAILERRERACC